MPLTKATQNVVEGIVSTGSTGVSAGSFIVGQQYKITSLGTTTQSQWNTIAGTTGQTYVVGSLFTAATDGASSGNGAAAVARTLQNRFADVVNVKDFGAVGNGIANDTTAIQDAINTGKSIVFPEGVYKVTSLTQSTNYQQFEGLGSVKIDRISGSNPLLFSTGRGAVFNNIRFDGSTGGSGNCVVAEGDAVVFSNCSVWTNTGHALWAKGGGVKITGSIEVYYSADATQAAIAFGKLGTQTLYSQIVNVNTTTSNVGFKSYDGNNIGIVNCQFKTVDLTEGSATITNCRIAGDYIVHRSLNKISNTTIAGDVTLGNGINAISGIGFASTVSCQSGTTVTINPNVRESSIHLNQTPPVGGVTINDNLTGTANDIANDIYIQNKSYTPQWTGSISNPNIGNGSLLGNYARLGRFVFVTIELLIGSTTTFGSGSWRFGLPTTSSGLSHQGSAVSTDQPGGTAYIGAATTNYANNFCLITTPTGNVGPTIPFTWGTGDIIRLTIQYPSV